MGGDDIDRGFYLVDFVPTAQCWLQIVDSARENVKREDEEVFRMQKEGKPALLILHAYTRSTSCVTPFDCITLAQPMVKPVCLSVYLHRPTSAYCKAWRAWMSWQKWGDRKTTPLSRNTNARDDVEGGNRSIPCEQAAYRSHSGLLPPLLAIQWVDSTRNDLRPWTCNLITVFQI